MYTKVKLYNLALSALLLTKEISSEDDTGTEMRVFGINYDTAFRTTLADLDLDSTSTQAPLEQVLVNPNNLWKYAYKYPSNCAFLRRIQSCVRTDNRETKISLRVGMLGTQKVIFTNDYAAVAEYIQDDFPLSQLAPNAAMAIAYKLAMLSAPLISGKGARELRKQIMEMYMLFKNEAQEIDRMENVNYETDDEQSEFVAERLR